MNTPFFQSFLAPYLHQFVQYKRALNRKYLNDAHTLRLFDRYLCTHNIADWHAIDSAVVDDFLVSVLKSGQRDTTSFCMRCAGSLPLQLCSSGRSGIL
jgi:hypothetical protein